MSPEPLAEVRIDRWLWAARLFKTRSLAAKACAAGDVTVNGAAVKPAKLVRARDQLEVETPGGLRIVEVVLLLDKRGPASLARTLYLDHTPPPPPKEESPVLRERGAGRPTKRDRRETDRWRERE